MEPKGLGHAFEFDESDLRETQPLRIRSLQGFLAHEHFPDLA